MSDSNVLFIDTNIFLRVAVKENAQVHRECVRLLDAIRKGSIRAYTSPLVLAEVMWVLQKYYTFDKTTSLEVLQSIVRTRNLFIFANEEMSVALALYEQHTIKFIDALIASNKQIYTGVWTLISYDKEFDKIKGVVRREPKYFLKKKS